MRPDFAAFLHLTVEIADGLAALGTEAFGQGLDITDAVDAEHAEILAQQAPADEEPAVAPEPQAKRADDAFRLGYIVRAVSPGV